MDPIYRRQVHDSHNRSSSSSAVRMFDTNTLPLATVFVLFTSVQGEKQPVSSLARILVVRRLKLFGSLQQHPIVVLRSTLSRTHNNIYIYIYNIIYFIS